MAGGVGQNGREVEPTSGPNISMLWTLPGKIEGKTTQRQKHAYNVRNSPSNPFFNPYLQEYFKQKRSKFLFTHTCRSGTIVDVYEAVNRPAGLICVPDWRGQVRTPDDFVEWAHDVVPRVKELLKPRRIFSIPLASAS